MRQSIASVDLETAADTERLGRVVAETLPGSGHYTLLLNGDLGAGKSTLARALIRALGHDGAVPSPTYTLVEPYELADLTVYHVDLYRIGSEEELRYLGWSELDDGLRIVEWPERAPGLRQEADLDIRLAYRDKGRQAEIESLSDRAGPWLAAIRSRFHDADAG